MSKLTFGIIVFPGTNCDRDCFHAVEHLGFRAKYLWYEKHKIPGNIDCLILPGGFSYGDYLRPGSIAKFAKIMEDVRDFAERGKVVLGICNGFQILVESGLLPGALSRNVNLKFICKYVYVVKNEDSPFTCAIPEEKALKIPIAHMEGRYIPDEKKDTYGVIFNYCNRKGEITPEANPNGSYKNIAGIFSKDFPALGAMMPHPERCSEEVLGSSDGAYVFKSIEKYLSYK